MVYQFENKLENVFNQTVKLLHDFQYTRYSPLLYYMDELTEFQKQQQRNVGGFMKGILVKRLESSFYAFKMSIDRFVQSHERFIEMFDKGTVYISKKVNVYDLLDQDNIDTLENLVDEDRVDKYMSDNFTKDYRTLVFQDLEILKSVKKLWIHIDEDPKLDSFLYEIKTKSTIKGQKIVVFTESKETGDYLFKKLFELYPGKVMFYSSKGALYENSKTLINHNIARELIKQNFDPKSESRRNTVSYNYRYISRRHKFTSIKRPHKLRFAMESYTGITKSGARKSARL